MVRPEAQVTGEYLNFIYCGDYEIAFKKFFLKSSSCMDAIFCNEIII